MYVNIPSSRVMGIVMMQTTMMVVLMMEVTAAPGLIHHMDGISIALFVNVKRMVMNLLQQPRQLPLQEEVVVTVLTNGQIRNVKNKRKSATRTTRLRRIVQRLATFVVMELPQQPRQLPLQEEVVVTVLTNGQLRNAKNKRKSVTRMTRSRRIVQRLATFAAMMILMVMTVLTHGQLRNAKNRRKRINATIKNLKRTVRRLVVIAN